MTPTQRNLIGNVGSQALSVAMGLFCLPLIVRALGMEAYGIVGIYWSLQSVAMILDFGGGAAANRELARLSSERDGGEAMRSIVRKLGGGYLVVGLGLGGIAWFLAPVLGGAWITPRELTVDQVGVALQLVGVAIALQWPLAFFSACVTGLQRLVALSILRAGCVTVSYLGGVLLLKYVSPTLAGFFSLQIVVGLVQLATTMLLLNLSLPTSDGSSGSSSVDWTRIRRFSAGAFGLSLTGLALGQGDKLLLSKLLALDDFGYYSLAATVSAGILSVGAPVFTVVFPRMSQLLAAGDLAGLRQLYHQAAQFLALMLAPVGIVLIVFSEGALLAWTGDPKVVAQGAPILRNLAVGSTLIGLTNVPYALQMAHGWTRWPLIVNILAVVLVLPLMAFLTLRYGADGAAVAWMVLGLGYVFFSVPYMHRQLLPGASSRWFLEDNGLAFGASLLVTFAVRGACPADTRGQAMFAVILALLLSVVVAALVVPTTRQWLVATLRTLGFLRRTVRDGRPEHNEPDSHSNSP